jgi:D-alanine-D-alanine ligase
MMQRTRIGVFFGGQSPEHEVSVITGLQAAAALDSTRFDVVPVYVSKGGHWFIGRDIGRIESYSDLSALAGGATEVALAPGPGRTLSLIPRHAPFVGRPKEVLLDVVFMAFHGGPGENGAVQGLCEALNVPYTGSGVVASGIGMDKVLSKKMGRLSGVPVVEWVELWESDWRGNEESSMREIASELGFPAIVKPVRLGSSIGISRVKNTEELDRAVEEAFRYDASVMVEKCVANLREINCSVLGNREECRVSVLEEPVSPEGFLSFKDKYMRQGGSPASTGSKNAASARGGAKSMGVAAPGLGASGLGASGSKTPQAEASGMASLDRIIPAPISEELATRISDLAKTMFTALDCSGLVRIDFLMDDETEQVWFNEINTIPGSLSFYLWQPAGIPFDELVGTLVDLALHKFEDRSRRVRSYDVNLLAERSAGGLKGGKA